MIVVGDGVMHLMLCDILNTTLAYPQMMRLTCGEGMVLGNVNFASFGRPDGRWPQ